MPTDSLSRMSLTRWPFIPRYRTTLYAGCWDHRDWPSRSTGNLPPPSPLSPLSPLSPRPPNQMKSDPLSIRTQSDWKDDQAPDKFATNYSHDWPSFIEIIFLLTQTVHSVARCREITWRVCANMMAGRIALKIRRCGACPSMPSSAHNFV